MRFEDSVSSIDLRVAGYHYASWTGVPRKVSDWLVVDGRVACPDGTWCFSFAALTEREAVMIAPWLRAVARHEVPTSSANWGRFPGVLAFLEPNLSFGLAGDGDDPSGATVRMGFSHEMAPPWQDPHGEPATVECRMTDAAISAAADDWASNVARYVSDEDSPSP